MGDALIHHSSWELPKPEAFMHRNALRLASAAAAVAAAAPLVLVPAIASAHPGHDAADLVHGFMHPLGGIDHILAMVAVGLLAARMGGRALWLVPASFVLTMAVAGLAGMAGVVVTGAEAGIALSVLVLGAMIAFGVRLPVAAVMGMVGFFAVFHGYAHGAEMPATASGFAFGAGFVAVTALLHGLGIALGLAFGGTFGRQAVRLGGAATMVAGAILLIGAI
jgi:urease accessory protein